VRRSEKRKERGKKNHLFLIREERASDVFLLLTKKERRNEKQL
jgi:hypothetical protein